MKQANYKIRHRYIIYGVWNSKVKKEHPDWSDEMLTDSFTKKNEGLSSLKEIKEYRSNLQNKCFSQIYLWDSILNKKIASYE